MLLCNFFLALGHAEAWVVLGDAVPEGSTAYVLTLLDDGEYYLWNPVTGIDYDQHDPSCGLANVGTVFNSHNVWVNVQVSRGGGDVVIRETVADASCTVLLKNHPCFRFLSCRRLCFRKGIRRPEARAV